MAGHRGEFKAQIRRDNPKFLHGEPKGNCERAVLMWFEALTVPGPIGPGRSRGCPRRTGVQTREAAQGGVHFSDACVTSCHRVSQLDGHRKNCSERKSLPCPKSLPGIAPTSRNSNWSRRHLRRWRIARTSDRDRLWRFLRTIRRRRLSVLRGQFAWRTPYLVSLVEVALGPPGSGSVTDAQGHECRFPS
jgi:hypothetical protein